MGEIVLELDELARRIERFKEQGKRVVFTNGGFDLLHVGHLRTLQGARELGDVLVVALNSDASIQRNKGPNLPIIPAAERAELVAALACVDLVTIFDDPRIDGVLLKLKPHIHAKGTDYTKETVPERETVRSYGGEVAITGDPKAHSTSWIIKKIRLGEQPRERSVPVSARLADDDELAPEHVDVTDRDKADHLHKIIQRVLKDTDKDLDAKKRLWAFWFFMYLIWWESDGLKRRKQVGGGPARGIIQMEPQTLWDVLKRYVLSAKTKGAVANLAKAAGVPEEDMLKAIKAFLDKNKAEKGDPHGKNSWPTDDPEASKIEAWLENNDVFAVKLLRYFFRWHGDEHLPPVAGTDPSGDPRGEAAKKEYAKSWGEGYNKGEEGKTKQEDFVEKGKALDKALAD